MSLSAAYDAYGNTEQSNLPTVNPFGYCGEYFDSETGFLYLRARYYDPKTGRFTAEDTHWNTGNMIYGDDPVDYAEINRANKELMGQLLTNPNYTGLIPDLNSILQSNNLYAYCLNNPVNFVDPSGESTTMVAVLVSYDLLVKAILYMLAVAGTVVVSFAIADAVSEFVKDVERNHNIFYAVDGNKLSKMKEISVTQALERVLSGQNVYTESQNAAYTLARIASFGAEPVHDKLTYNAHYHIHKRKNRAHIFYGCIR